MRRVDWLASVRALFWTRSDEPKRKRLAISPKRKDKTYHLPNEGEHLEPLQMLSGSTTGMDVPADLPEQSSPPLQLVEVEPVNSQHFIGTVQADESEVGDIVWVAMEGTQQPSQEEQQFHLPITGGKSAPVLDPEDEPSQRISKRNLPNIHGKSGAAARAHALETPTGNEAVPWTEHKLSGFVSVSSFAAERVEGNSVQRIQPSVSVATESADERAPRSATRSEAVEERHLRAESARHSLSHHDHRSLQFKSVTFTSTTSTTTATTGSTVGTGTGTEIVPVSATIISWTEGTTTQFGIEFWTTTESVSGVIYTYGTTYVGTTARTTARVSTSKTIQTTGVTSISGTSAVTGTAIINGTQTTTSASTVITGLSTTTTGSTTTVYSTCTIATAFDPLTTTTTADTTSSSPATTTSASTTTAFITSSIPTTRGDYPTTTSMATTTTVTSTSLFPTTTVVGTTFTDFTTTATPTTTMVMTLDGGFPVMVTSTTTVSDFTTSAGNTTTSANTNTPIPTSTSATTTSSIDSLTTVTTTTSEITSVDSTTTVSVNTTTLANTTTTVSTTAYSDVTLTIAVTTTSAAPATTTATSSIFVESTTGAPTTVTDFPTSSSISTSTSVTSTYLTLTTASISTTTFDVTTTAIPTTTMLVTTVGGVPTFINTDTIVSDYTTETASSSRSTTSNSAAPTTTSATTTSSAPDVTSAATTTAVSTLVSGPTTTSANTTTAATYTTTSTTVVNGSVTSMKTTCTSNVSTTVSTTISSRTTTTSVSTIVGGTPTTTSHATTTSRYTTTSGVTSTSTTRISRWTVTTTRKTWIGGPVTTTGVVVVPVSGLVLEVVGTGGLAVETIQSYETTTVGDYTTTSGTTTTTATTVIGGVGTTSTSGTNTQTVVISGTATTSTSGVTTVTGETTLSTGTTESGGTVVTTTQVGTTIESSTTGGTASTTTFGTGTATSGSTNATTTTFTPTETNTNTIDTLTLTITPTTSTWNPPPTFTGTTYTETNSTGTVSTIIGETGSTTATSRRETTVFATGSIFVLFDGQDISGPVAKFTENSSSYGLAGSYSALIDWGDGDVSNGVVADGEVLGRHTYTHEGDFSIIIQVSDGARYADQEHHLVFFTGSIARVFPIYNDNIIGSTDSESVSLSETGNAALMTTTTVNYTAGQFYVSGSGGDGFNINTDITEFGTDHITDSQDNMLYANFTSIGTFTMTELVVTSFDGNVTMQGGGGRTTDYKDDFLKYTRDEPGGLTVNDHKWTSDYQFGNYTWTQDIWERGNANESGVVLTTDMPLGSEESMGLGERYVEELSHTGLTGAYSFYADEDRRVTIVETGTLSTGESHRHTTEDYDLLTIQTGGNVTETHVQFASIHKHAVTDEDRHGDGTYDLTSWEQDHNYTQRSEYNQSRGNFPGVDVDVITTVTKSGDESSGEYTLDMTRSVTEKKLENGSNVTGGWGIAGHQNNSTLHSYMTSEETGNAKTGGFERTELGSYDLTQDGGDDETNSNWHKFRLASISGSETGNRKTGAYDRFTQTGATDLNHVTTYDDNAVVVADETINSTTNVSITGDYDSGDYTRSTGVSDNSFVLSTRTNGHQTVHSIDNSVGTSNETRNGNSESGGYTLHRTGDTTHTVDETETNTTDSTLEIKRHTVRTESLVNLDETGNDLDGTDNVTTTVTGSSNSHVVRRQLGLISTGDILANEFHVSSRDGNLISGGYTLYEHGGTTSTTDETETNVVSPTLFITLHSRNTDDLLNSTVTGNQVIGNQSLYSEKSSSGSTHREESNLGVLVVLDENVSGATTTNRTGNISTGRFSLSETGTSDQTTDQTTTNSNALFLSVTLHSTSGTTFNINESDGWGGAFDWVRTTSSTSTDSSHEVNSNGDWTAVLDRSSAGHSTVIQDGVLSNGAYTIEKSGNLTTTIDETNSNAADPGYSETIHSTNTETYQPGGFSGPSGIGVVVDNYLSVTVTGTENGTSHAVRSGGGITRVTDETTSGSTWEYSKHVGISGEYDLSDISKVTMTSVETETNSASSDLLIVTHSTFTLSNNNRDTGNEISGELKPQGMLGGSTSTSDGTSHKVETGLGHTVVTDESSSHASVSRRTGNSLTGEYTIDESGTRSNSTIDQTETYAANSDLTIKLHSTSGSSKFSSTVTGNDIFGDMSGSSTGSTTETESRIEKNSGLETTLTQVGHGTLLETRSGNTLSGDYTLSETGSTSTTTIDETSTNSVADSISSSRHAVSTESVVHSEETGNEFDGTVAESRTVTSHGVSNSKSSNSGQEITGDYVESALHVEVSHGNSLTGDYTLDETGSKSSMSSQETETNAANEELAIETTGFLSQTVVDSSESGNRFDGSVYGSRTVSFTSSSTSTTTDQSRTITNHITATGQAIETHDDNSLSGNYALTESSTSTSTTDETETNSASDSLTISTHATDTEELVDSYQSGNHFDGTLTSTQTWSDDGTSHVVTTNRGRTIVDDQHQTADSVETRTGNSLTGDYTLHETSGSSTTTIDEVETNAASGAFTRSLHATSTDAVVESEETGNEIDGTLSSSQTVLTYGDSQTTNRNQGQTIVTGQSSRSLRKETRDGNSQTGDYTLSAAGSTSTTTTDQTETNAASSSLTVTTHATSTETLVSFDETSNRFDGSLSSDQTVTSHGTSNSLSTNRGQTIASTLTYSSKNIETRDGNTWTGDFTLSDADSTTTTTTNQTETNVSSSSLTITTLATSTETVTASDETSNENNGNWSSERTVTIEGSTHTVDTNHGRTIVTNVTSSDEFIEESSGNLVSGDYSMDDSGSSSTTTTNQTETNAASSSLTITSNATNTETLADSTESGNRIDGETTATRSTSLEGTLHSLQKNHGQTIVADQTSSGESITTRTGNAVSGAYTLVDGGSTSTVSAGETETNTASSSLTVISHSTNTETVLSSEESGNEFDGTQSSNSTVSDVGTRTSASANHGQTVNTTQTYDSENLETREGNSWSGDFSFSDAGSTNATTTNQTETNAASSSLTITTQATSTETVASSDETSNEIDGTWTSNRTVSSQSSTHTSDTNHGRVLVTDVSSVDEFINADSGNSVSGNYTIDDSGSSSTSTTNETETNGASSSLTITSSATNIETVGDSSETGNRIDGDVTANRTSTNQGTSHSVHKNQVQTIVADQTSSGRTVGSRTGNAVSGAYSLVDGGSTSTLSASETETNSATSSLTVISHFTNFETVLRSEEIGNQLDGTQTSYQTVSGHGTETSVSSNHGRTVDTSQTYTSENVENRTGNSVSGDFTLSSAGSTSTTTTDETETNASSASLLIVSHSVDTESVTGNQEVGNSFNGTVSISKTVETNLSLNRTDVNQSQTLDLVQTDSGATSVSQAKNLFSGAYSGNQGETHDATLTVIETNGTLTVTAIETGDHSSLSEEFAGNNITGDSTVTSTLVETTSRSETIHNQSLSAMGSKSNSQTTTSVETANLLTGGYVLTETIVSTISNSETDSNQGLHSTHHENGTDTESLTATGNQLTGSRSEHSTDDTCNTLTLSMTNGSLTVTSTSVNQMQSTSDTVSNDLTGARSVMATGTTSSSETSEDTDQTRTGSLSETSTGSFSSDWNGNAITGTYTLIEIQSQTITSTESAENLDQTIDGTNHATSQSTQTITGNDVSGDYTLSAGSTHGTSTQTQTGTVGDRTFTLTDTATDDSTESGHGNKISQSGTLTTSSTTSDTLTKSDTYATGFDYQSVVTTGSSSSVSTDNSLSGAFSREETSSSTATVTETGERASQGYSQDETDTYETTQLSTTGNSILGDQTVTQVATASSDRTQSVGDSSSGYVLTEVHDATTTLHETANLLNGTYTQSETATQSSSLHQVGSYGGHTVTADQEDSSSTTGNESGDHIGGDFTRSAVQTSNSTLTLSGSNSSGTIAVTRTADTTATSTESGNTILGTYELTDTGASDSTLEQSFVSIDREYFLTESATNNYTTTRDGNSITGEYSLTTTGTDSFSNEEAGHWTSGSGPEVYDQTYDGDDDYTLTETGNELNGGFDRTLEGSVAAHWWEVSSLSGSGPLSDDLSTNYTVNEEGNYLSGKLDQTFTGTERHGLLKQFDNFSNAVSGSSGGVVDYSPLTGGYFMGSTSGLTGGGAMAIGLSSIAASQSALAQQGLDFLHEYCFAAGTMVLAANGLQPIESFQPGDIVFAVNDQNPTARAELCVVEQVYRNAPARLLNIHVGDQVLRTTLNHPFYVQGKGWIAAARLSAGDLLRTADTAWVAVTDLFENGDVEPVFNLRVADHHTYFVGDRTPVLVHNTSQGWVCGIENWAGNFVDAISAPDGTSGSSASTTSDESVLVGIAGLSSHAEDVDLDALSDAWYDLFQTTSTATYGITNGIIDAGYSFVTLGFGDSLNVFPSGGPGYNYFYFAARIPAELALGWTTGYVSGLGKVGWIGKVAKAAYVWDVASNAATFGRGFVGIVAGDGLTFGNILQVVAGAAGLGGNWLGRGAVTSMNVPRVRVPDGSAIAAAPADVIGVRVPTGSAVAATPFRMSRVPVPDASTTSAMPFHVTRVAVPDGCFVAGTLVRVSRFDDDLIADQACSAASAATANDVVAVLQSSVTDLSRWTDCAIESVPLGSRTGAKNPDRADYDLSLPEPDPETWQVIEIELNRFDGATISIELLRPREWIEARGWSSGQVVHLSLPDMEAAGFGRVQAVRPCPQIVLGEGAVVIGRFATSHAPTLTRVRFEGGTELLGTAIHPIWSADREDWVGLGALTVNERVLSREGPIRVLAVELVRESRPVYNIEVHGEHVYEATEVGLLVHNSTPCNLVSEISLPDGRVVDVNAPGSLRNWRGDPVRIPEGHIMSPRDPAMSAPPIVESGPFTTAQRNAMLAGESGGTRISPHHRHQIPATHGGVIDELPGPGHPSGNNHTGGSPSRHPSSSIFNAMEDGKALRQSEITSHWQAKGQRMVEVEPDMWIDPGF